MSDAQAAQAPHQEDHDAARIEVTPTQRRLILLLVQVSTLVFGVAITATNVVVPQIRGALSLTQEEGAWIVTLFLVAAAVATPLTGWVAGKLGWRRFMVTTMIGFTVSSLLCGMANSLELLLAARFAQGLFGAPLMPLGQGMLLATFPRHQHAAVLMWWGVGSVMGPTLGPILGGLVAESLNWRWAFIAMAPIGVLTTLIAMAALRDQERGTAGPLGITGFLALAVGLSSAQLMLDRGHRLDWFDSMEITLEAVLAVAGLLVFVVHTAKAKVPFLDPRLFRDWNFSLGLVVVFIMGAMSYTLIVLYPPLLQDLRHFPDATIGALMSARGLGNFCSFIVVVPFTRYNARLALMVGMVMQVWAGWQMTHFNINVTPYDVYMTNFVQGFGFGLAYTPMTVLAFSSLPPTLAVQGSAVFNLMRNFGSSLFISLTVLLLVRSTAENYAGLSAAVSSMGEVLGYSHLVGGLASDGSKSLATLSEEIKRQAAMGGYVNGFVLFTVTAAAGIPLAWMFRLRRMHGPVQGRVAAHRT